MVSATQMKNAFCTAESYRGEAMVPSALPLQASVFLLHAQSIMSMSALHSSKLNRGSRETTLNRFRALFGVTPLTCAIIWNRLRTVIPEGGSPNHLLWALLFMKIYATEHVNRSLTGADEKTLRKWIWTFVELISNLSVVSVGFSALIF